METLYNDVHPTLAPTLQEAMIPHALLAFETPAGPAAWAESEFDGRRAYIRTTEDQTIPAFVQDAWIEKSGVEWDVAELKASHCPFVSMPVETAEMVIGFVGKWI